MSNGTKHYVLEYHILLFDSDDSRFCFKIIQDNEFIPDRFMFSAEWYALSEQGPVINTKDAGTERLNHATQIFVCYYCG